MKLSYFASAGGVKVWSHNNNLLRPALLSVQTIDTDTQACHTSISPTSLSTQWASHWSDGINKFWHSSWAFYHPSTCKFPIFCPNDFNRFRVRFQPWFSTWFELTYVMCFFQWQPLVENLQAEEKHPWRVTPTWSDETCSCHLRIRESQVYSLQ